jgi:hypothetical protein
MTEEVYKKVRDRITEDEINEKKVHAILYPWDELVEKFGTETYKEGELSIRHPKFFVSESFYRQVAGNCTVGHLYDNSICLSTHIIWVPIEFIQIIYIGNAPIPALVPLLQKVIDYV